MIKVSKLMLVFVVMAIGFGPVRATETAMTNSSSSTPCAEIDNVTFYLTGPVTRFFLRSTHPESGPSVCPCQADFTNCPPPSGQDYEFMEEQKRIYDNGDWVLWAYRLPLWWRPTGMTVTGPLGTLSDAHYIAVSKKIAGVSSWPQFFVIYQDGNTRLIPHPPAGMSCVCFGSSVIVGPVVTGERPLAEISSVTFNASDKSLSLAYVAGGNATLKMAVDRISSSVEVTVNYATDVPYAALRSMYVAENNCDVARVQVRLNATLVLDTPVLVAPDAIGDEFLFYRLISSMHNQSAPDIRILSCGGGSGDGNGDGMLDGRDITGIVKAEVRGGNSGFSYCAYDLNQDGIVTIADELLFVASLLD